MSGTLRAYPYDVAFSFAGEDRAVVLELATLLERSGVRVFYDDWSKADLWGRDLYQHLDHVYSEAAQFCLIFISKDYVEKAWTKHELRSAQARAFGQSQEYILPVRLDDTPVPGLPSTIGYIDLRREGVAAVAELLLAKLRVQAIPERDTNKSRPSLGFRIPRIPRSDVSPVVGASLLVNRVREIWDKRTPLLESAGLTVLKTDQDGKLQYEVKKGERLVYFLRIRPQSIGGGGTLSFHDGWNYPIIDNASTALASLHTPLGQNEPLVNLINLSLIKNSTGVSLTMSVDELVEAVWEKACDIIESLAPRM